MPTKIKKPKKKRKLKKASKSSTGTNITINVGTAAPRAPRRRTAAAPAKPKLDQFGFRPLGSGGGGTALTPSAEQFRQVIYTPQGDVGSSIKALEKSIESLSRSGSQSGGSQYGRPPILGVGSPRDDESELGDPEEEQLSERLKRAGLKKSKLSPIAEGGGGTSPAEIDRLLKKESSTEKAQKQMMRQQYAAEEQEPLGSF